MTNLTDTLAELENRSPEDRYNYLLEQAIEQQQLWILVDDGGSVLLTGEGGDCVPVWPHEEAVQPWITEDWSDCKPMAIALFDWQARWTKGLREDGYDVAVYPNLQEEAVTLSAEDFDDDLISAMSS